jgi:hypothetical protein
MEQGVQTMFLVFFVLFWVMVGATFGEDKRKKKN